MAFFGCLALFLCGIWDVISQSLNSCLGRTVGEALDPLRERAVAEVRDRTRFWGNRVARVNTSAAGDLAGMEEIRGYEREIVDSLRDGGVRVIGIHGMGGIGKTTLLERINNNFSEIGAPPDFDVVIYATVSKEAVSLPNVRKSIGKRIGLDLSSAGDSAEEQADLIFKTLDGRRFLLLLDDVWEEIRLKDIGIPQPTPQNKCKVILTTRSKDVCRLMRAEKLVEVKGLSEGESWRLFKENVAGVDLESPPIYPHAKAVAHRCGGLPLALNTVGRAMADANRVEEWKEALAQLTDIPGMTEKVLIPLKFSYERLSEENLKQCLLYCCLYPEDYEIEVKKIIELWVGEGFLDKEDQSNTVVECRNRGFSVITRLVKASLLQQNSSAAEHVKMHDVVREMCLWLTQNVDNAFLVLTGETSNLMSSFGRWEDKKRISMMGNTTEHLPDIAPSCPCLQTLLCPGLSEKRLIIPQGFFQYMPLLRVLDLSNSVVESLPDDIGLSTELRYLDLRRSPIESLPKGFGRLTKLTQLNLNRTRKLRHIPLEAIPVLTYQVRVLRMFASYDLLSLLLAAKNPPTTNDRRWGDREGHGECSSTPSTASSSVDGTISKIERRRWNNLEEVELSVTSLDAFNLLLSSDALCKCCIKLEIMRVENIPNMDLALAFAKLENVRSLRLEDSSMEEKEAVKLCGASDFGRSLEELFLDDVVHLDLEVTSPSSFRSLRWLDMYRCHGIRHIDWVRQLPSLQIIELIDCENIGELLLPTAHHREGHCDSSSLLSLRVLTLVYLPALTCISSRPMLFPALKVLDVRDCPKLSKLPLVSSSGAPDMERIRCRRSLWESLEDGTQSCFLPVYKEVVEDEEEEEEEEVDED